MIDRYHAGTIPRTSRLSGPQAALDAGAVQDSAGYLFNRDIRRVEHRNACRSSKDSAARTSNATCGAEE